ncbi:peptidoglycan-binding protein [Candidatus Parcubacteria bacterium]|nr:peptidoglycan-binding protein [Candidatus Parcubacteria bacterium]
MTNPVVRKDGQVYATSTSPLMIYDTVAKTLTLNVTGFSTYDITEGGTQSTHILTAGKTGSGTGVINGISATTTTLESGVSLTLTATANPGSTFTGWSGDCTGTGTCLLLVNSDKLVNANFTLIPVNTSALYQNTNILTFDGTSLGTGIAVDDSKITNKLSVSASIIRNSDSVSYPSVVSDEDYTKDKGYYLGDTSSGTNSPICFRVNGGKGNNSMACESTAFIGSTAFTHYLGVFDGTTKTISLYRNGVLVSQKSHPSSSVSIDSGTELVGAGFKGKIKNVQISNIALTATQAATTGAAISSTLSSSAFTRNLTIGATGSDVVALQRFLNTNGFTVASSGAGSRGNESSYFGQATAEALARFQASKGIAPASGYFGAVTREVVGN